MMMNVQFGDCSGSRDLCHTQTIYETVDMEWMKALTTTFYGNFLGCFNTLKQSILSKTHLCIVVYSIK